jgi:hypothetical protein
VSNHVGRNDAFLQSSPAIGAEGLKRASLRCAEAVGAMNRPARLQINGVMFFGADKSAMGAMNRPYGGLRCYAGILIELVHLWDNRSMRPK